MKSAIPGDYLDDAHCQQNPTPGDHLEGNNAFGVSHDEALGEQRGQPVDRVPHPENNQEHADPDDHPEPARPAVRTITVHALDHCRSSLRGTGPLTGGPGPPGPPAPRPRTCHRI